MAFESVLSMDEFSKPRRYEDDFAKATLIMRLIVLEPGQNLNHPLMGVGIQKRRFTLMEDTSDLEKIINDQIRDYLPELLNVRVDVSLRDRALYFGINIDKKTYVFKNVEQSNTVTFEEIIK